jgi:HD-GYP domain-containing protein (c-di-GMP phosphodiesterase class II)/CheY-like chemotaxis protein
MQFKDLMKSHDDVERAEPKERPDPGKSVVVAEPEPPARETLTHQVIALGYMPLIASDGTRALELAREYQPRLVIANLELGGTSGPEVLAALRQDPATRDIAVMLVSNTDETPDMVVGSQVGADDYICKPIDGAKVKARIRELLLKGADEVTIPPPQVPEPAAEEPDETAAEPAEPAEPAPGHIERAETLYEECRSFVADAKDRAKQDQPPDIDRCRDLARRLVQECSRSNRLLLKAIRPYEPGERSHDAPNVAVFSVKIGTGLNYNAEELTALAMAALCHDLGMAKLPDNVLAAEGKYSRRQSNQLHKHPEYARDILAKLGDEYGWLAEAVYQAHERERGQGYPQGLKGDEIGEFAKVIGLADTYESLSHPRSFRKAFIAFDALREIIGMRDKFFPAHLIRALVSEVSVFPLESYVLLNTGETARVVRTHPDNLLRPVVVVEHDASGNKVRRPKIVDLAARPLLYVTKPVDERDLPQSQ